MKILYAIQGTGNGHLSRARDIIPILQLKGDLDILVSGTQADLQLPYPVKYNLKGLSFIFGKNGGIDLFETYRKTRLKKLIREINKFPIEQYDLVINDFEPVSAWACYLKNKPCYALSHQAAVLNPGAPQPKRIDIVGRTILKRYAPAAHQFGFHFKRYSDNIFTPVIRAEVRQMVPVISEHYTVYLPSYSEKRLVRILSCIKDVEWQVFSKHSKKSFTVKNVSINPIDNEKFLRSMAESRGVLTGAGFETPAEALYLKKKLMVIPMKGQYEQQCNAAALKEMGVMVLKRLKIKHVGKIKEWIMSSNIIEVEYPDITSQIIDLICSKHEEESIEYSHLSINHPVNIGDDTGKHFKSIAGSSALKNL
jgi:uncharacterized protein (TIGR00661 family)